MNEFGIPEKIMAGMLGIFAGNEKIERAVLFGSRAKNSYSDVDVALFGNLTCLDSEEVAGLLDELPSPLIFGVLAHGSIKNPALSSHICSAGKVVYERRRAF